MKKLTKLQYEVIFLYSRGLTFKEIDTALATASRGVYSQVVGKDKSRVTRAKLSRETNLNSYKEDLKKYLDSMKEYKKYFNFSMIDIKANYRNKYINTSLDKAYKSYCKYKLTFLKNHLENSH
jgi:hypothetical protein